MSLISGARRAAPLVWLPVNKNTLKSNRSFFEYRVSARLAELLPSDIKVCIVADRGFGDQKLYRMLTEELKFGYVIRFRGNITVTTTAGETRTAAAFVGPGGRARILRGALVTCRPLSGGDGAVRAGQGDETGLVSGRQQRRRDFQTN